MCWGSPGAGKLHAGKYEELTSLRQRGGGGWQSGQPPPYPLSQGCAADPFRLKKRYQSRNGMKSAAAESQQLRLPSLRQRVKQNSPTS